MTKLFIKKIYLYFNRHLKQITFITKAYEERGSLPSPQKKKKNLVT